MVIQSRGRRKEFVSNGKNEAVTQSTSSEELVEESVLHFPNPLDSCKSDVRNAERNVYSCYSSRFETFTKMANRFFKSLVGNWSLERKCLLFLGLALLGSLLVAFVAVQIVASRLVMETTRQSARDHANSVIGWKHINVFGQVPSGSVSLLDPGVIQAQNRRTQILELLKGYMLESSIRYQILRIDDNLEHESLAAPIATGDDLPKLNRIYERLAERELANNPGKTETGAAPAVAVQPNNSADDNPAVPGNEQGKPVLQDAASLVPQVTSPKTYVFEDLVQADGYYLYYQPIAFDPNCLTCHANPQNKSPFRVMRVQMPYSNTRVLSMWSYSILTSIAICTLATSLFFIHWVLKSLVIRPLSYLKQVSEEITRGDTKLRFQLETEDEFFELAESFNRMLRHLTETQDQLQSVNKQLDLRVDELARVNLQLFEANRLKGDFMANMSHELRTPLNSILGFSEVLQGFETLTDKQRRYASNIQSSGRLLLDMINDILDLAKVEAGKMEVRPTEFCVLSVMESQCEILRKMAEDKNIDLRVDSSQTEMRISQDQGKLQQILTNLLSNAIKFTPEGGLVTVSCEWLSESDFFMSVSDTGVGVAETDHEVIFEKFRQANGIAGADGLTREFSGTGLGLSIVRELCRLLGGDITLKSQLGCGSTFRVVLPRNYATFANG